MSKALFVLSLISGLAAIALAQCPDPPPTCGPGEVYTECGSACPKSCATLGNTCQVCTQQCVCGCFCAGDTIKAPDGSCVHPKQCPKRTCPGPNEVFKSCPPYCPRTDKCSELWSKFPCEPIDCCEPKCVCKSGHYRNDAGLCGPALQC